MLRSRRAPDRFNYMISEITRGVGNVNLQPRSRSIKAIQVLPPLEQSSMDNQYPLKYCITVQNAVVKSRQAHFVNLECASNPFRSFTYVFLAETFLQKEARRNSGYMGHANEYMGFRSYSLQVFYDG
jgi:hypothetical protein